MSDDPNEFRVINLYGDDPIPSWVDADGSAVTEFPARENLTKHRIEEVATNLFWPLPQVRRMTPELKARLLAGGFSNEEVERGGFMLDSHGNLAGVIMLEPSKEVHDKPPGNVASPETADFKAWLTDQMGFPDRLYFWTSSRGDHWEKIEADSAEAAAIMQAERWSQKGHRGPFAIMVSVSGLEHPPRDGDRVWVFDVNPDVLFRATHQGFYCFKSPSK